MEEKFRCEVRHSEALYKELYSYMFFKRPIYVIIYILLGLCLLDWVLLLTVLGETNYLLILVIVAFFVLEYYLYSSSVKNAVKRGKEMYGGFAQDEVVIYDDKLTLTGTKGVTVELPLNKVKKIYVLKNLIVLMSDAKLMYIMTKSGFTLGTSDEFLDFLREKGIYKKRKKA